MTRIGLLLIVGSLVCGTALAQEGRYAALAGTVVDAETGAALEGVHVFVGVSMIGTVTDATGRYRLDRVPLGAHQLYASRIGYELAREDLHLHTATLHSVEFRLTEDVVEIEEMTVEARADRRWQRRLRRFERMFIGETANADSTRILNPEVMDFEGRFGRLQARAAAPILIENRALGYRIRYFLKEFEASGSVIRYDGDPLFEPLEPRDNAEAALWEENRRKAFYGSFRHFMLALLDDLTKEEGYLLYIRPGASAYEWDTRRFPVPPGRLLRDTDTSGVKTLRFAGAIEVIYQNEGEEEAFLRWQGFSRRALERHQTSFIRLTNGPTTIDPYGEVVDPYGVTVYGYFAFERVATQLPKEYRPRESRWWMAQRSPDEDGRVLDLQ